MQSVNKILTLHSSMVTTAKWRNCNFNTWVICNSIKGNISPSFSYFGISIPLEVLCNYSHHEVVFLINVFMSFFFFQVPQINMLANFTKSNPHLSCFPRIQKILFWSLYSILLVPLGSPLLKPCRKESCYYPYLTPGNSLLPYARFL